MLYGISGVALGIEEVDAGGISWVGVGDESKALTWCCRGAGFGHGYGCMWDFANIAEISALADGTPLDVALFSLSADEIVFGPPAHHVYDSSSKGHFGGLR
ncbi:MAG: hypothetical protein ACE5IR_07040 [bacterium]